MSTRGRRTRSSPSTTCWPTCLTSRPRPRRRPRPARQQRPTQRRRSRWTRQIEQSGRSTSEPAAVAGRARSGLRSRVRVLRAPLQGLVSAPKTDVSAPPPLPTVSIDLRVDEVQKEMVFLGETVLQVSRLWPPRAVQNGRSADYRRARLADLAAARPRTEGRWPAVEGRCPIAMSVLSLSIFRVFVAVVSVNEQQGRLVGEQSRRMRVLSAPGPRRRGGEKGRAGARAARPSRFASTTPAAALLRLDTIHLAPNTMLSRSAFVRPASLDRAVRIVRSSPDLLLCRAREVELTLAVSALFAPPPPRPPSGPLCRLDLARSQPALARSLQTAADASTPATKVPEDANELVRPFVRRPDRRRPGPF